MEHNHGGTPTYVAYAQGCRHFDCLQEFNDYKLRLAQRKLNGEYVDLRLRANQLQVLIDNDVRAKLGRLQAFTPHAIERLAQCANLAELDAAWDELEAEHLVDARGGNEYAAVAETIGIQVPEGEPVPAAAGTEPAPDPPVDPQQVQAVSVDPGATTYRDKVLNYLNLSVVGRDSGKLNPAMMRIMPTVLGMQPEHCQAVLDELDEAGMLAGDGTDLYLVAA